MLSWIRCGLILSAGAASWVTPITAFAQAPNYTRLAPFDDSSQQDASEIKPAFAPFEIGQSGAVRSTGFAEQAPPTVEFRPAEPVPAPSSDAPPPAEELPFPSVVKNYVLSDPVPADTRRPVFFPGMFGQAFGMVLLENKRPVEAWRQNQRPDLVYFGLQFFL